jgi:hypothetical protein
MPEHGDLNSPYSRVQDEGTQGFDEWEAEDILPQCDKVYFMDRSSQNRLLDSSSRISTHPLC